MRFGRLGWRGVVVELLVHHGRRLLLVGLFFGMQGLERPIVSHSLMFVGVCEVMPRSIRVHYLMSRWIGGGDVDGEGYSSRVVWRQPLEL